MKKSLIISVLAIALVLISATSAFAAESLASKIYEMGKAYGVTEAHKAEMEKYFTNHPVSAAQESYVLGKAKEAIKIMDDNGVKDVTKLSKSELAKIQNIVKAAATELGIPVEFTENGVKIGGGNSELPALELTFSNPSTKTSSTTSSGKIYVPTGANYTTVAFAVVSLVVMVIAGTTVVKLRRNA